MENGLRKREERALSHAERPLIWLYFYSEETMEQSFSDVIKTRPNNDSAIIIRDIQPEDLDRMKGHRKRNNIVVCKDYLKTDNMQYVDLQKLNAKIRQKI